MRQWLVQQRLGILIGTGVTLAALLVHGLGGTDALEWQIFYTWMVRHCSRIPASDRILHIDIDDDSLQRFASWPWPRDVQGELVRILHELEARQVVLDIVWSEPNPGQIRAPSLDPYADLEGDIRQAGELSAENVVFPDEELAEAVTSAGPVYLALYYNAIAAGEDLGRGTDLARRMTAALREDFSLDGETLARKLAAPPADVAAILAGVKRSVAQQLVSARMNTEPPPTARQIHESLLRTPFERLTADRADILSAYHRELGIRNLKRCCRPVPPGLRGRLPKVVDLTPPLYKLTGGPARIGFVNFDPDSDGTIRRIPLMVEWDGRLLEQLAFAAARDDLQIADEDMSLDETGHLVIAGRGRRPAMRVQLDDHGQALINWHAARTWAATFGHLPVMELLKIHEARQRIRENQLLRRIRLGEAMRLAKDEAAFAGYRQQVASMLECRRRARAGRLRGQADNAETRKAAQEAERLAGLLEQDHAMTTTFIRETWSELSKEADPSDPAIAADCRRFKEANRIVVEELAAIDETNRRLEQAEAQLVANLRPRVAGKTCFVGYAASAVADMIAAPPYDRRVPGVLIHSQLYNSFLQGQFRRWAGRGTQLLVIALLGLSITIVATVRGPQTSLLFVVVYVAVLWAISALGIFRALDCWLAMFTGLLLVFIAWALIVMVRYLVTDRQRRVFSRAVARYVSPAMARRIAESAQSLSFDPVDAVVSCFFSDLAGFTTLSERLGPAGTRAVLNPYLEAMSAVLHRRAALINKFMGDGVFAFFNPPILPCPGHEIAACEAALDSRDALAELIARNADGPWGEQFRKLHMRVGIASGPVFVGDYGSEDKLDYTCMGDVVNLAARLESANKQFGTAIMVSGATREATGDRFTFRHLGRLQVKGQTRGVAVYELLGRNGGTPAALLVHAALFDRALDAFCRRDFPTAQAGFEACLHARADDTAAQRYLAAIVEFLAVPPSPDWPGTLELTEK